MSIFAIKIAAKLQKKPEISLIICTHDRAHLLDESLAHYSTLDTTVAFEILVVANACSDHTLEVITKHQDKLKNLRVVEEKELGHSNARNTGWQHAVAPFVFYMDDDAYPASNLINHLHAALTQNEVACLSGRTIYWPANSPSWITPRMVEVPQLRHDFGPLPKPGYINGCACGFSVDAIHEAGGFNPTVGMKGKSLGYYDEIYLQEKLEEKGYTIYYHPEVQVHHQSHLKTVDGFLKSAFHKGRSRMQVKDVSRLSSLKGFILSSLKGLLLLFPRMFMMQSEEAVIESFKKPMTYLGQLTG